MASRIRVEERRRAVARRVLEIAATATDHFNLLELLTQEYGNKPLRLDNGHSRTVYELPQGLVLKACASWSSSNETEWEVYQKRPDLVVTVYGRHQSNNAYVDILIARRARIDAGAVWDCEKHKYKSKRAVQLSKMVYDFHSTNVGFIGKRLMIVDAGNGLAV